MGALTSPVPREAFATMYAYIGPDSTLAGWDLPSGGTWRLDDLEVDLQLRDLQGETATIPDGTHRLWVNLLWDVDVYDSATEFDSGSTEGTARVEDLLIVLTPVNASGASVELISR